jgi:hypothetical protein
MIAGMLMSSISDALLSKTFVRASISHTTSRIELAQPKLEQGILALHPRSNLGKCSRALSMEIVLYDVHVRIRFAKLKILCPTMGLDSSNLALVRVVNFTPNRNTRKRLNWQNFTGT